MSATQTPMTPPTLLAFGYGFSASALGDLLMSPGRQAEGWRVRGTSRTPSASSHPALELWQFSRQTPLPPAAFEGVTHVLVSIAPGEEGDPVLATHRAELERLAAAGAWIGYLSTTGVYGDHGGGWVTETTPIAPATPRSHRRAAAEQAWLDLPGRVQVFRLSGIYGPGRSQIDALRNGSAKRLVKPGQVFNRIHVADIATVLAAAMMRPCAERIFNLADDEPAPPQDVVAYAAELLGIPAPPEEPFNPERLSPMAQEFYSENKRVRNDRIKQALGVTLAYPTYREGLRACL